MGQSYRQLRTSRVFDIVPRNVLVRWHNSSSTLFRELNLRVSSLIVTSARDSGHSSCPVTQNFCDTREKLFIETTDVSSADRLPRVY